MGSETEVTRRTHVVHHVHVGDVVMRAGGCRWNRAIFPVFLGGQGSSICPRPLAARHFKHHDSHIMSVAVAAGSLREGVGECQVLLSSNIHCTSELLRPAVTFNQDLFSGIPRSHAEYLGHARLVAARIRCHLRPKYRKEGQLLRQPHPIIGRGVIDGKPKQTHLPTDTASHRAVISAYLLIRFGWFTDPLRSWLFLPAWIALSDLPPSKTEGCIHQLAPSSFPVDVHCYTQSCEFHCCWGSFCTVNHPSIPISHISSSTHYTTNNRATLQQHAFMSCMSLYCIHQTIPLAMLLMIFHAAPKPPIPA